VATILAGQGVTARIDVFGGASLALVHSPDRTATADVDGAYHPVDEVTAAAEQVAAEMGLVSGWLNDRMKFAIPPAAVEVDELIQHHGVTIRVGSARTILAMKLRASRPARDFEDIAVLLRACNIRSASEAVELFDDFYLGEEAITPVGHRLLERAFGEVEVVNSDPPYTLPPIAPREVDG
jgi:hypothetical protein